MPTLDAVPPGQGGRISSVAGPPALMQRLFELGLMEGEDISVVARAPLGDPVEVQSRLTRLSLRKSEAAYIHIVLYD